MAGFAMRSFGGFASLSSIILSQRETVLRSHRIFVARILSGKAIRKRIERRIVCRR
jgi:hypothetical protein